MTHYNPLKHPRRSIRLKGFDYSQSGLYFITICCQNMIARFGEVQNGRMILNQFGEIAHHEWEKTPEIRNNIALGEFIIMPNHMHGIIQILDTGELHSPLEKKSESDSLKFEKSESDSPLGKKSESDSLLGKKSECNSQKFDTGELHSPLGKKGECNSPQQDSPQQDSPQQDSPLSGPSNSIGAVVRGYKSAVTRQISLLGFTQKLWLRNYYEHIIRDELSHQRISNYIKNNPSNWKKDKFY